MNLFEGVFAHNEAAPAIQFGGRQISYGELRLATLRMAQAISALGVQRGVRVALLLHDSPEFITAFMATCSLGAIAVPINLALRLDEQCSILPNSSATLAIAEADLCSTLPTHAPEKLRSLRKIVQVENLSGSASFSTDEPPWSAPHFKVIDFPKPAD